MIIIGLIFLLLIIPNLILIYRVRKSPSAEDPAKWGLVSGFLPMIIVALWDVYFIIRYHKGYTYDEMKLLEAFNLMVFVLIPILVPIYANLIRKRSKQALMKKRLLLFAGLFGLFMLYFNLPLSWDFTFVIFPFCILVMAIGFCFLRRKKAEVAPV